MGLISSLFSGIFGGDEPSYQAPEAPTPIKAPKAPVVQEDKKSLLESMASQDSLLASLLHRRRLADISRVDKQRQITNSIEVK